MKNERGSAQAQSFGRLIGSNGWVWVPLLQNPAAWRDLGVDCKQVETIETHRAWVFLAGDRVLKLKKPCRDELLDFSTPPQRRIACQEELRLNRRLAPGVYLGLVGLQQGPRALHLARDPAPGIEGEMQDWAVLMRRLPAEHMLDQRLLRGPPPTAGELEALADVLARFWSQVPRAEIDAATYLAGFTAEHQRNGQILRREELGVRARAGGLLTRFGQALAHAAPLLRQRIEAGQVRDGHGDLRPEHIALTTPPVVIDALEFSATLRAQDPYDELAFLGLECARLGAPGIGEALIEGVAARLGDRPPAALLALYRAHRALLRARLALVHLLEPPVRHPERWPARAEAYLALADRALQALDPVGPGANARDKRVETPEGERLPGAGLA